MVVGCIEARQLNRHDLIYERRSFLGKYGMYACNSDDDGELHEAGRRQSEHLKTFSRFGEPHRRFRNNIGALGMCVGQGNGASFPSQDL